MRSGGKSPSPNWKQPQLAGHVAGRCDPRSRSSAVPATTWRVASVTRIRPPLAAAMTRAARSTAELKVVAVPLVRLTGVHTHPDPQHDGVRPGLGRRRSWATAAAVSAFPARPKAAANPSPVANT